MCNSVLSVLKNVYKSINVNANDNDVNDLIKSLQRNKKLSYKAWG